MTKLNKFTSVRRPIIFAYSNLITFEFHAIDKNGYAIFSDNGAISISEYEDYLFHMIRKEKILKIRQKLQ